MYIEQICSDRCDGDSVCDTRKDNLLILQYVQRFTSSSKPCINSEDEVAGFYQSIHSRCQEPRAPTHNNLSISQVPLYQTTHRNVRPQYSPS